MTTPADKLERHLAEQFVRDYITMALRRSRCAVINPHAIFMAARLAGLKVSLSTLEVVLRELQQNKA